MNDDNIKAVVGNIPIKQEKKKKNNKKKTNSDYKYPLWTRIFVWVMAIMMLVSFAGGLIGFLINAMSE